MKNPYDSYLMRNNEREEDDAEPSVKSLLVGLLAYLCFMLIANQIFP